MSSFTFAELEQALQDWPENSSGGTGEYVDNIPRIISLAETRLVREMNLDIFDYLDETVAISQSDRLVPKPDDLIQVRDMHLINADGVRMPLILRSYGFCQRYAPDPVVEAQPIYFCELNELEWMVVPTPDDDYLVASHYIRRPAGLSVSNTSTWFSEKLGDLLFTACLMEAEQYLKADDRYGDMKTKYYEELLPAARLELRRSLRMGDYQPFKPAAKSVE